MAIKQGPGRPSLGERTKMTVRVPCPVYDALRREAHERGISMNQLVSELASEHLDANTHQEHTHREAVPA